MEPVLESTLALTADEASTYSTILEATSLLPKADPRYALVIGVTWWLLHRRRRLEQQLIRRRQFSRRLRRIMTMRWHLQRNTVQGLASAFEATEQALMEQLVGLPEKRLWVNQERTQDFWSQISNGEFTPEMFLKNFHMSQGTFDYIYGELEGHLKKTHTTMREPLPAKKRLAVTLFRLATNTEYLTVANLFGIGKSTTTSLIRDVCDVIVSNLRHQFLNLEIKEDTVSEASRTFDIPQVMGTLGAMDVFITGTPCDWDECDSYSSIYHSHSSYAFVFQGFVDYKGQFKHVSAIHPAGLNNFEILKKSGLNVLLTEKLQSLTRDVNGTEVPALVVADESYRKSHTSHGYPWILTSSSSPSQESKRDLRTEGLNDKIHKALEGWKEAVIKVKSRWKVFHGKNGKINFNADGFENIALACCILHNICEQRGDIIDPRWTVDVKNFLFLRKGHPAGGDNNSTDNNDTNDTSHEDALKFSSPTAIKDALLGSS